MKYKDLIKEQLNKTVVFAFGRMQPITIGHELLIQKVVQTAKSINADHFIFLSKSQDKKKNPLPVEKKIYWARKLFPGVNFAAASSTAPNFLQVLKQLNKKYSSVIMIAGSDRIDEFKKTINKYNGDLYNYNSIKVISSGERDADTESASGMSGTKMRIAAANNNFNLFKKGVPGSISTINIKTYMNDVRTGMGLNETYQTNKSSLRELHIEGKVFNVGDIVDYNKHNYLVLSKQSNYLTVVDENYNISKKFVKDLKTTNSKFEFNEIPVNEIYEELVPQIVESEGDFYSRVKTISLIAQLSENYSEKTLIELIRFCNKQCVPITEKVLSKTDSLGVSKLIALALNEPPTNSIQTNIEYVKKHAAKMSPEQKSIIKTFIAQIALKENVIIEKITKQERMKRKNRFKRTKAKRERAKKIALKKRSNTKTLEKRARKAAIKSVKLRFAKKPLNKLSASEKERLENIISKRKSLVDRLTRKLVPKERQIEKKRLSENNENKTLNKPFRSNDGKKKFYVYVKNAKGNVIKLGFGDPNMEIKRDDPERRSNFRARHNCENPGPKWKARYWSCRQWRADSKVEA